MDKFGIFNLISSFLTEYKNKNDALVNPSPSVYETKNQTPKEKAPSPAPPLQADMLKTIKEHDAFVKRVLKNGE